MLSVLLLLSLLSCTLFGSSSRCTAEVDFLYVEAYMDNLEYASSLDLSFQAPNQVSIQSQLHEPQFQWKPGVALSLSTSLDSFGIWNASVTGTYIYSHAKDSVNIVGDVSIAEGTPIWFPTLMGQLINFGSADWKLNFGTVDFGLDYLFYSNSCFSLSSFFALRGVCIDQTYDLNYTGLYNVSLVTPEVNLSFINDNGAHLRNTFLGIGPRFGSQFLFPLFRYFNIIGELGCSLLCGHFHIKQNVQGSFPSDDTGTPLPTLLFVNTTLDRKYWRLRWNIDSEIGLEWSKSCGCGQIVCGLSYLFSIWFNQLEFHNSFSSPSADPIGTPAFPAANIDPAFSVIEPVDGNLQFQGIVLRAALLF